MLSRHRAGGICPKNHCAGPMSTDDSSRHRIATQCWKHGNDAVAKQSWDYAIEMYSKAIELAPENLLYRQSLRAAEHKMYNNNKTGARMSGLKLATTRGRIQKNKMTRNWKAVDQDAENGLKVNPWDAQLNYDMGEACLNLGYPECAQMGFEQAVENDPNNKDYLRQLALLLEERGDYKRAISCWERVKRLDPNDGEARQKITGIGFRDAAERGGFEEAETTQDVRAKTAYDFDRPKQNVPEAAAEGPGVSLEADLQRAIRKDPANRDNYTKLADYYRREGRLEESVEQYRKALEVGGDPNIREIIEDVELEMLKQNLAAAKESAGARSDDETAQKNVAALTLELWQREVEVLSQRVERYPKDMRLKFELGKRLMRGKKYQQAIQLLQQASADSRLETEVLVMLGECFIAEKQKNIALRQFEKAIPQLSLHDQPDLFKKAHYYAGRICEETGKRDDAENHYQEILAVDYSYQDTLKRLERLQGGGGGDGEEAS